MKHIKYLLRRFLLIVLIVLAGIGVGLSGGIPLPSFGKREDKQEITNESVEETAEITNEDIADELQG